MGATESLISRIRGCDWIPFSPDKKYSPTCQLVLRISYFPQKYFSIKINFAFRQNDICGSKQSPSVGDDNFIPHDSWSSAVIDRRSKSGNDQKFFPLSSSSQCSSSWSIFYHHLLLFGQLTNNMYVVSNSLTQCRYTFLGGVVLVIFVVVFLLNNLRHDGVPVDGVLFWFVVGVSTAVHCR